MDNLDDFLTSGFHTNRIMDELSEDESHNHCYNFIQTTSAGNVAVKVNEEVGYGFKFSGYYMKNNIVSLLARDSYDIKSGKYINHYLQKKFLQSVDYICLYCTLKVHYFKEFFRKVL